MLRVYFVTVLWLTPILASAQHDLGGRFQEGFFWGFKAGVTQSKITGVRTTLIAPIYPVETYMVSDDNRMAGLGCFYIDYRHSYESYLVARFELGYTMQGGVFKYQDIKGLEYQLAMNYDYLTLSPLVKVNIPPDWPYFIAGLQLGVNVTPEVLRYTSSDEDTIDLQVQESLRTVLKGRSNLGITAGLGFELGRSGLNLEGRYTLGFTDVIETQANSFLIIENKNTSSYFQFTLGMPVPFR